ncbi:MAG: FHA domain-containing protein, partial [Myxococcota bacterium]
PSGQPICWRCRGIGDTDAEFCKFCGARYGDAPEEGPGYASSRPGFGTVPDAPPAAPSAAPALVARLVSIRKDGSDGEVFPVHAPQTDIGRSEGEIVLPDDPYLSPRHARLRVEGGRFYLRDLGSVNGTFQRLRDAVPLEEGDRVLIGQQLLRFERVEDAERPLGPASVRGILAFGTPEVPRYARLVQYTTEGVGRDVHYLYRDETVLGRETGDVVFTDDPFLSRRHASITLERGSQRVLLRDLGSSNGTSVAIRGEVEIQPGDCLRVGRHLFRFDAAEAERQR